MVIILKSLLVMLMALSVSISVFIIMEYRKFISSEESDNMTLMSKIITMTIAFGSLAFFMLLIIFSFIFVFKDIQIN